MKTTDQTKIQIYANLQLLKESTDTKVREKAYQDILALDLTVLHTTLGERIQIETDVEILAYIAEILIERDHESGIDYILPL